MKTTKRRTTTHHEWLAEGARLFGDDRTKWRFVCPCCGHVATPADYKAAGAEPGAIGFSCIGRWTGAKREAFAPGEGPCNYAGGGLFPLNPVTVMMPEGDSIQAFEFARPEA